ncbi:MAG: glycosyl transferase family 2, partial [Planctomycetes bacterium]|nr:glycosyl transferase family 2 [Planctomycetota bacterium]
CFRLLITSAYSFGSAESPWNVQVSEVSFDSPARRLSGWGVKAARTPLGYSPSGASYVSPLEDEDGDAGGDDGAIRPQDIRDLGGHLAPDGRLEWDVPPGRWTVLRIGHTPAGYEVKCSSPGGGGLEMDWLGARAMDHHFASTALKLLEDAGPLAGKTLRYFHDDSWEVGVPNWTEGFLDEFRQLRGYDARPYLPVLTGRIVGSAEISDRFLYDYRKTIADCLVRNHYQRFRELCHRHGVLLHSEGGGPCTVIAPMDALRNLGQNDVPMGEFWHSGHWKRGLQNDVGKQTASAAHTYGKRFAAAEAFTSIGPHWEEGPADLKPTADVAFCEGINRCFLHTSTLSPAEAGRPGYEYFAGTHFNRNITWWEQSPAWLLYLSRCQFLLSEGIPVADACFYYGDHAPNFVAPKSADPALGLGPGYDYDVCDAHVLLHRMRVEDGRIVLPDGVSYRLLVLPDRTTMPAGVLRKLKELVEAGATILGPRPLRAAGLEGYPRSDDLVRELAGELWGPSGGESITEHRLGKGRVIRGRSPRDVLQAEGAGPDFAYAAPDGETFLDFIHRALEGVDIYFVANRRNRPEGVACSFRVSGRRPELWDPVTGEIRPARAFRQAGGRTEVPLRLAPHGSIFVVFRGAIARDAAGRSGRNWPVEGPAHAISGPWAVRFDPAAGGPAEAVELEALADWTRHPDPRVRFYSGAAVYAAAFDLPPALRSGGGRIVLDLREVHSIAEVRLNGEDLGVVWTAPWRVDITAPVRPEANTLEIEVVNLWPNRLVGDQRLEPAERIARTNVAKFTRDSPLLPSGLLGPVTVRRAED